MTNSPFDDLERPVWERGFQRDDRFAAGLRIDPLLLNWPATAKAMSGWGYRVGSSLSPRACGEARRFLEDWTRRLQARYLMVSLPPDFRFPDGTDAGDFAKAEVQRRKDHLVTDGEVFLGLKDRAAR